MTVRFGEREYIYGPGGNISIAEFYELQKTGLFASTAGINPDTYTRYFEPTLQAGKDILYLCFSSGLSGMIQSSIMSIEELREQYPEREIVCIDTLCASLGEGFLVIEAARKQSQGLSLHGLEEWVLAHRLQVCHWFTVDRFDHLLHGGRVSAVSAVAGTVLQIKPLLHVDEEGCLVVAAKPRGRKNAIAMQLEKLEQGWLPDVSKLIIIGHGNCPDGAEILRQEVTARFPQAEIMIMEIGPVIGAHTSPGMLAVLYWGNTR